MNELGSTRLLVWVTAFKVVVGMLCLTFVDLSLVTGAGGGALPPVLNFVTLTLFAAAAGPLLIGGRRDARAIYLGATFLAVASFFINRLLLEPGEALEPGLLRFLVLTVHWIPATALLPLFLWLFAREFPQIPPHPVVDRLLRWGYWISVTVALGLTVVTLPKLFEAWSVSYQAPSWSLSYMAGAPAPKRHEPLVIPLALVALLVMGWKRRYAPVRERRRVTLLIAGLAAGLLPIMSMVLLEQSVPPLDRWLDDPSHRRWIATLIYPVLLSIPFTTAYAVLVQNALELRFIARKALQYSLAKTSALTLAAVPMAGLLGYLYRERTRTLQDIFSGTDAFLLTLAAVFGVAAVLNRQALLDSVDRRFFREQFDARQILTPLVERIRNASNRRELASLVIHGVDRALHMETVCLLVEDPDRGELVDPGDRVRPLPSASTLSALVGSNPHALPVDWDPPSRALEAIANRDRQWLVDGDFRLLVPVFSLDGALTGMLALGEKKSSLPFLREDRQLLSAIAHAAGLALDVERMKGGSGAHEISASSPVRAPARGEQRGARECYGCGRLYLAHSVTCTHCQRDLEPAMVPYVVPGRFRFEQRIGTGGMGVVYRAVDLALSRPVAVKTMRRVSVEDSVRLRREARAAAKVVHPNLALIYGVEIWQGTPMLILEYLAGGTLEERLSESPLTPEETLSMGIDLSAALEQLHLANILHRDLKPSNIGYGADGSPKLMDFGIARLEYDLRFETSGTSSTGALSGGSSEARSITAATWTSMRSHGDAPGKLVGTLHYLSPEAVQGEPPDPSIDLWGLCLVLYECLIGQRVFRGTVREVMEAVSQARIPPLSSFRPDVPEALEEFFLDALAKDRSRRAASAEELQRELRLLRNRLYERV
ncbi:MAG: serine/threonine-protein kinase [Acidobacteriota bacterium]